MQIVQIVHFSLNLEIGRNSILTASDFNYHRFIMYIKLFFGMWFFWSMEIVSGLLTQEDFSEEYWYFTDVLNMMQGFYVFVIFVCNRNVYKAILGSLSRLVLKVRSVDLHKLNTVVLKLFS